ncbi:MAG: extracellular solute-binding protein [Clostridiales Family XIII bacterium]|jgi:multiple sugar transport system substrate-binding protein|nr:extracellular solute-binding protein [Clostridiales Family XIII bacterium]
MKKRHLLILVLALIVSLLAACSGSGGTGSSEDSGGTGAEDSAANSGEGGTIVFYGFSDWMDTDPYKEQYEAAKAQFEEEFPGFTVELQSDPWGDWEQKYKTMFASGNAADVFMVNNPDFPSFANSGNLLALGDYVDAGYFDSFFPGVNGMYVWQNEQMAIPFTTDCRILWYNKDIFTAAGLDPEKPPTTWEELVTYAKAIEEKTDSYGFGMDLGLQEFPAQSLYCASSGDIIEVADDGSVTPNVNTDEFKGYMNTLLEMKPTFEADYTILNHHDVAKLFVEGQMGIIIGNTLNDTDIYDKEWYGQGLIPSIDGKTNGSFGGGFGISISSECKYPEQAVRFAQIVTSPEYCSKLISDVPASEEGIAQSEMAKDAKYDLYFEQIQYARQAEPKTLYYAEIDMAVYDAVTEVLVGGKSVDDAVAALEENIKSITAK